MGQDNSPLSYYVERTPPIADFVWWVTGLPPNRGAANQAGNDPADDPPELDPTARLLSVLGPPGCGKTAFLVQLHAALVATPGGVIVLPLLDLKKDGNPRALWKWFTDAVAVAKAARIDYSLPQRIDSAPGIGIEVKNLCAACDAHHQIVVIVLVDGFEETGPEQRQDFESFLAFIVAADNAKMILTRRDEQALTENLLRWVNEQEVSLALLTPEEQIRQRLERDGQAMVRWPRETWEDDLDIAIAALTAAERAAVLTALTGHLTSNPYINARLLALKLEHPHLPPATLKRLCLESYLERAKLNADYADILAKLVGIIRASGATNDSFTAKQFGSQWPQSGQHEALMVAGIVSPITGTHRYQLDSAVAALI